MRGVFPAVSLAAHLLLSLLNEDANTPRSKQ